MKMKELLVSTFPRKQQEILKVAKKLSEIGPVTATGIASIIEGSTTDPAIKRIRSSIFSLKKKSAWPYNDNGKPGFAYCNYKLVYDSIPPGKEHSTTKPNSPSVDYKDDYFMGEPEEDESTTLPTTTPTSYTGCDIPAIIYLNQKDKEQHAERDFTEDLMECFWLLTERSRNRLWPSVANLIAKIIEPHN